MPYLDFVASSPRSAYARIECEAHAAGAVRRNPSGAPQPSAASTAPRPKLALHASAHGLTNHAKMMFAGRHNVIIRSDLLRHARHTPVPIMDSMGWA